MGVTPTVQHSRPPLERMMQIHEQLSAGRKPNCSTLAREFEVSTKTIQRDLDFMRDRWTLPIAYDEAGHFYHYTEPVNQLPTVTISEGELVALLVAQKAVEQYRGTPFEQPLSTAFSKLVAQLPGKVTVALGDARAVISFRSPGSSAGDLETFRRISTAVLQSVEIEFDYRKLASGGPERRRVQPWHLACVNNQWYVIGWDCTRGARRTFAVPRVREVKLTKTRFTRPADFSIEKYLGSSFGIIAGEGDHAIRVRFDAFASQLVRERFWHSSQTMVERRDGTVELTLRLGSLEEIERWILGWGEHAEVLSPVALRRRIATVAGQIAVKHK
ncbi:MAG TPA: WYL domain-containing transcriptional regulator [Opitutaceae bacterium]|nr:WYL domain-containing transcriptional regulator [Opitutaceae bacterium]